MDAVAYAGKNFGGGVQGRGSGLVGGPGAEIPGSRRIFENLKKFLKKIAQNAVFSPILQRKFQNHAVNFCAFGRKTQLFGKF